MAYVELVIKIPEDDLDCIKYLSVRGWASRHELQILKGTLLPKGHGRIVDIGQIDRDKIEKDNPIICLTDGNGVHLEAISLEYLDSLQTLVEADR